MNLICIRFMISPREFIAGKQKAEKEEKLKKSLKKKSIVSSTNLCKSLYLERTYTDLDPFWYSQLFTGN